MTQNGLNYFNGKMTLFGQVKHGGGSGSGGGQNTTTVQKSDPWTGQQPYLTDTFSQADNLDQNYTPSYYNGSTTMLDGSTANGTVAPLSNTTNQYMNEATNLAQNNPLVNSTNNMLNQTENGYFLNNSNPYLQSAENNAANTIMPQMDGKFESSGRYGSGTATTSTAQALANEAGQMSYQNYNDGQNNMLKAGLEAPGAVSSQWNNLGNLATVGGTQDSYNQNLVNANVDQWNYNQQLPYEKLNAYAAITNNGSYGSSSMGTQTQGMYKNPWLSAAGGAMAGASAGNAIDSSGYGAGIGGVLGAVSSW